MAATETPEGQVKFFVSPSTSIKAKATLCYTTICPDTPVEEGSALPLRSVLIEARSANANKAISIVQIAKREIEKKGGTWYQYTKIGSRMVKNKKRKRVQDGEEGNAQKKAKGAEPEKDAQESVGDHDFAKMEIDSEKEEEGEEVEDTTITIHLSNQPNAELAEELGEQTNKATAAKNKKSNQNKKKKFNNKGKGSSSKDDKNRGANVLIRTKDYKKRKNKDKASATKS